MWVDCSITHLDRIVKALGSGVEGEVVEGADRGSLPPFGIRPLDLEHVITKDAAEHDVVRIGFRLHLVSTAKLHIDIFRLKTKFMYLVNESLDHCCTSVLVCCSFIRHQHIAFQGNKN